MNKDKKQMLVLGVLVLVVVAVGAFQFMGAKPKPAATTDTKKDEKKDETLVADNTKPVDLTAQIVEGLMGGTSGERDPFAPQAVLIDEPEGQPGENNMVNPVDPNGGKRPPTEITGQVEPWPVNMNQGQGAPGTFSGNGNNQGNGGNVEVAPVGNGTPYALRGVMIGRTKKMCMLETTEGKQILVLEGQKLGKELETTVIEITENYVVLSHRGKVINLALLGGN